MSMPGRLYGCPVELSLDVLGGKWKTVILARLKQGPHRYGELRRSIPDLADKVLSQRLRDLEDHGMIERLDDGGAPCYALTQRGAAMAPALQALYDAGLTLGSEIGVRFRPSDGRDTSQVVR
jgi:DNA-binding HxlR family transcriptional regulator